MTSEQDNQPAEEGSPRVDVPAEAPPEVSTDHVVEIRKSFEPGIRESQPFDPDTRAEGGNPNKPQNREEGRKEG